MDGWINSCWNVCLKFIIYDESALTGGTYHKPTMIVFVFVGLFVQIHDGCVCVFTQK